jgi:hypothetical protein
LRSERANRRQTLTIDHTEVNHNGLGPRDFPLRTICTRASLIS